MIFYIVLSLSIGLAITIFWTGEMYGRYRCLGEWIDAGVLEKHYDYETDRLEVRPVQPTKEE